VKALVLMKDLAEKVDMKPPKKNENDLKKSN
jgi:hypothetical protein